MEQSLQKVGVGLLVGVIALVVVRMLVGAVWGGLSFIAFLFSAIAVIDTLTSSRVIASKVLWIAIIVLFPFLGVLAYWFLGRESQSDIDRALRRS